MDKRRQSILKQDGRIPLQETVIPDFPEEDTATVTVTKSRRVSFGANFVKEFIVGSAVSAQFFSEYEQAFSSSDSSNPNSSRSGILDRSTFQSEDDALNLCVKPNTNHDEFGPVTKKYCFDKSNSYSEINDRNNICNNENVWDFNVSNNSNIFAEKSTNFSAKPDLPRNNLRSNKKVSPLKDSTTADKQFNNKRNESEFNSSKLSEPVEKKTKVGKFSSTIFFSADSPTADVEFTEGCISLAKSIFDKKKKDMTVYIKGTPKESKKEEERDGNKTVIFGSDDSDDGMKLTKCVDESESENDLSTGNLSNCFPIPKGVDTSEEFNESHENIENVPMHMYSLNLMLGKGDNSLGDAELEKSLFFPERSLTEMLRSDPLKTTMTEVDLEKDNTEECDMEISSSDLLKTSIIDGDVKNDVEKPIDGSAKMSPACPIADEEDEECLSPVFSQVAVGGDLTMSSEDPTESELLMADPLKMSMCNDLSPAGNGDSDMDQSNCGPLKVTKCVAGFVEAKKASSSGIEHSPPEEESEKCPLPEDHHKSLSKPTAEVIKDSGIVTPVVVAETVCCSLLKEDKVEILVSNTVKVFAREESPIDEEPPLDVAANFVSDTVNHEEPLSAPTNVNSSEVSVSPKNGESVHHINAVEDNTKQEDTRMEVDEGDPMELCTTGNPTDCSMDLSDLKNGPPNAQNETVGMTIANDSPLRKERSAVFETSKVAQNETFAIKPANDLSFHKNMSAMFDTLNASENETFAMTHPNYLSLRNNISAAFETSTTAQNESFGIKFQIDSPYRKDMSAMFDTSKAAQNETFGIKPSDDSPFRKDMSAMFDTSNAAQNETFGIKSQNDSPLGKERSAVFDSSKAVQNETFGIKPSNYSPYRKEMSAKFDTSKAAQNETFGIKPSDDSPFVIHKSAVIDTSKSAQNETFGIKPSNDSPYLMDKSAAFDTSKAAQNETFGIKPSKDSPFRKEMSAVFDTSKAAQNETYGIKPSNESPYRKEMSAVFDTSKAAQNETFGIKPSGDSPFVIHKSAVIDTSKSAQNETFGIKPSNDSPYLMDKSAAFDTSKAAQNETFGIKPSKDSPFRKEMSAVFDTSKAAQNETFGIKSSNESPYRKEMSAVFDTSKAAQNETYGIKPSDDSPFVLHKSAVSDTSKAAQNETFGIKPSNESPCRKEMSTAFDTSKAAQNETFGINPSDDSPFVIHKSAVSDTSKAAQNETYGIKPSNDSPFRKEMSAAFGTSKAAQNETFGIKPSNDSPYFMDKSAAFDTSKTAQNETFGIKPSDDSPFRKDMSAAFDTSKAAQNETFGIKPSGDSPFFIHKSAVSDTSKAAQNEGVSIRARIDSSFHMDSKPTEFDTPKPAPHDDSLFMDQDMESPAKKPEEAENPEMEISTNEIFKLSMCEISQTNEDTMHLTLFGGQNEKSCFEETQFSRNSLTSQSISEKDDRTSLGDKKILSLLAEQAEESNCCWTIDSIAQTEDNIWRFSFPILKNSAVMKFKLRPPKDKSIVSFSVVLDSSLELQEPNIYQLEKHRIGVDFAFSKFKQCFQRESHGLDNVHKIPLFLDRMNLIMRKLNGILQQVIRILKDYPGSQLKESVLTFRLYSFPLLFSYAIMVDLSDPFQLSENSVTARKHFGNFNTRVVKSTFKDCLGNEEMLVHYIRTLTESVIGMERETGSVTKRSHIRLIT